MNIRNLGVVSARGQKTMFTYFVNFFCTCSFSRVLKFLVPFDTTETRCSNGRHTDVNNLRKEIGLQNSYIVLGEKVRSSKQKEGNML